MASYYFKLKVTDRNKWKAKRQVQRRKVWKVNIFNRNKLEYEIDVLQRKINDSSSDQTKQIEIRVLELKSTQHINETKINERVALINDTKKEIEEYEAALHNNKEQSLALQREKLKEIATR